MKFKNKLQEDKISVGLDIGSSVLKLVKLKVSDSGVELLDFNSTPAVVDIDAAIKKITESLNIKSLNISLSGPSTIIRYVNFTRLNSNELKQALRFEAEKHIPFPISEVNLDGFILKSELADNKMLVALAAAKKELINQRLKLLELAGIRVNIIDIDSLALINAFNFNYTGENGLKDKAVALLNIGTGFSNLNILEGSIPHLSRDIHIAGNNFTQKIQDNLGLDFKAAEELKLSAPADKLKDLSAAVEPPAANLAAELRTSFDYYESQSASSVEKIYLSGGGSLLAGLKDILANLLEIEVDYWDPLKKINVASSIDAQKLKQSSIQLAVATGLALRS